MIKLTPGEVAEVAVVLYQAMERHFHVKMYEEGAKKFIRLAIERLEAQGILKVEGRGGDVHAEETP
uniref:Uncharacterized protein n=1 Tax=viral metagenome TaxID=1070528 RepID=A0A6M3IQX7_9ZZZZ